MKALVLEAPEKIVVKNINEFPYDPPIIKIKVEACGICGSDIRYYHGENPWALHTLGENRPNPPNIVLGHEYCGTVVESPDPQYKSLVGQRISVFAYRPCAVCYMCKTGRENLCPNTIHIGHGAGWGVRDYYPGGMAEYSVAWGDFAYPLADSIPSDEAALLDVLGVGCHATDMGSIVPGEPAAILGCGPIGAAILQFARLAGASPIFVTDIYEKALSIALETGADRAFNAADENVTDMILDLTKKRGCSAVFDTIGTLDTLRQGLQLTGKQGTFVEVAVHNVTLPVNLLHLGSERTIRTSCNALIRDYQKCINFLEAKRINVKPWITHRFPLKDAVEAFTVMDKKEKHGAFKIIIKP